MKICDLRLEEGSKHAPKRVGRGPGSGHGKTSCRGQKGQKARGSVRPGFEGGQTPLYRRLPKTRGFTNIFTTEYAVVNVSSLNVCENGSEVSPQSLCEMGMVSNLKDGLKILGDGNLERSLTVKAHKFTKTAVEKIEAAGGKAEVI